MVIEETRILGGKHSGAADAVGSFTGLSIPALIAEVQRYYKLFPLTHWMGLGLLSQRAEVRVLLRGPFRSHNEQYINPNTRFYRVYLGTRNNVTYWTIISGCD